MIINVDEPHSLRCDYAFRQTCFFESEDIVNGRDSISIISFRRMLTLSLYCCLECLLIFNFKK